jgi:putative ATP-binding cassette transporter
MSQVLKSDLITIDSIGRPWILQTLLRDTQVVSQSILVLVNTCQSAGTVIFLLLYLSFVSIPAFIVVNVCSVILVIIMYFNISNTADKFSDALRQESEAYQTFSDFMEGYKEVKMNSKRAAAISEAIVIGSLKTKELKTSSMLAMVKTTNTTQVFFYAMVAISVFILPILFTDYSSHVQAVATTIMFLIGSLAGFVGGVPQIIQANASAAELFGLEQKLQAVSSSNQENAELFEAVDSIEIENIYYDYSPVNEKVGTFHLGPINYTFESGKIYFIRGNNGSGKSTLMRLLIGIYQPSAGKILVNGTPVVQPTSKAYRDLFAVVFSDFYLFKKLYGIFTGDEAIITNAIELLAMEKKITIENDEFSNINLSTGQRKRLALIVALLEEKQYIVLDEWASDQDPEFRKYFYESILPELRKKGKTIIAITHDDYYFHCADAVLQLDKGRQC